MGRDDVRVVRRFSACVPNRQGESLHAECERERRRKDGVLAVCSCKCHVEVDAAIAWLEKRHAHEGEQCP
jgi:hypothetical protein